jgi:hypothetical protein
MADNETDPPDTWEARLAYAEELHAYVCRLSGCEGRDHHERRTGTSFMAVVTNPRAGSAYGVPAELAEYLPPDFAAPVASAPADVEPRTVGIHPKARAAAYAALAASLAVQIAQGLLGTPDLLAGVSPSISGPAMAIAQAVVVLAAAYQAGVGRVTTS